MHALAGESGMMDSVDYRGEPVIAVYDYFKELDMGLVVKRDVSEIIGPAIRTAMKLVGVSMGAVAVCVVVLAYALKRMLDKVETEWVEGKAELMREKQQFSSLVEAMYPPAVAEKLLAGEHQIVFGVQQATVFFSDIHEFTALSNNVTSTQLIHFLGYTFGVMDTVAEYLNVYKIKTIGDAYLAITGLPGSRSARPSYDMLTFASYCAQIFSDRYNHPNQVRFGAWGRLQRPLRGQGCAHSVDRSHSHTQLHANHIHPIQILYRSHANPRQIPYQNYTYLAQIPYKPLTNPTPLPYTPNAKQGGPQGTRFFFC